MSSPRGRLSAGNEIGAVEGAPRSAVFEPDLDMVAELVPSLEKGAGDLTTLTQVDGSPWEGGPILPVDFHNLIITPAMMQKGLRSMQVILKRFIRDGARYAATGEDHDERLRTGRELTVSLSGPTLLSV